MIEEKRARRRTDKNGNDRRKRSQGGRTLRLIRNCTYDPTRHPYTPDERDAQGAWLYVPQGHGRLNDRDLVTTYTLDAAGRVTLVTDPLGHATGTTYGPDGRVVARTDALGRLTTHVHDGLGRLRRVVQNHVPNGEVPAEWVWDDNDGRWEKSDGTPIDHGPDQDQNIVVEVALDLAGRKTGLTDPRGYQTSYTHDRLDRRTGLTDPLAHTWATAYGDLPDGAGTRVELTNPLGQVTRRDSDRLGRPTHLSYPGEAPRLTPDVAFGYDLAGNRTRMSEDDGTNPLRETLYAFDAARRLTGVDFDTDGDGLVEQSVTYEYDAGGLRTKLTLPGGLSLSYTYDARGQLVGLEDWDGQVTRYRYDLAGRLVATERADGFRTRYVHDAGGRLRELRHARGGRTLGHFAYEVDALGNRTQAYECLPRPGAGQTVLDSGDPAVDYYRGMWTADGDLVTSPDPDAALRIAFFGDAATLTLGVGPDHGLCDVYVDSSLWQSFDNYADLAGEDEITLPLQGEGPHILEVRNRSDKNRASTDYKVSFKSLVTESLYDLHTIQYGYDGLSRLQSADYFPGGNVNGAAFRQYGYSFDLAGNRTQEVITLDGTPTTTNYTYNAANQITSGGVMYDAAGRMISDGVNTFVWDRADRLLSYKGVANAYNGLGQRVSQTVDDIVTDYLLDVQPGLWKVIAETAQGNTTRYVHGPQGIQAYQNSVGSWGWTVQDGLGSVRLETNLGLAVGALNHFAPYGVPFGIQGLFDTSFGFTGEETDSNSLLYLRTRQYAPKLGSFIVPDSILGVPERPLSLNPYSWVEGNVVNMIDPSGECGDPITCAVLLLLGLVLISGCTASCTGTTQFERDVIQAYETAGGVSIENEGAAFNQLETALQNLIRHNSNILNSISDAPGLSVNVQVQAERPGDVRLMQTEVRNGRPRILVGTTTFRRVAECRLSETEFLSILAKEHQHVYDHSHFRNEKSVFEVLGTYGTEERGYYVALAYLASQGIEISLNADYPVSDLLNEYNRYGGILDFGIDWQNPNSHAERGPCYFNYNNSGAPACR